MTCPLRIDILLFHQEMNSLLRYTRSTEIKENLVPSINSEVFIKMIYTKHHRFHMQQTILAKLKVNDTQTFSLRNWETLERGCHEVNDNL